MNPELKRQVLKNLKRSSLSKWYDLKLFLALKWIDVRYGAETWFCLKTWKWRFKHTKRLHLYSMAYNHPQMGWDDVEVKDQWGLWLPIGFGIISQANWDFDQKINADIGAPSDTWTDFVDGDWPTYYYRDEFLTNNHYFDAARKNIKRRMGDDGYKKEFELRLLIQSQESLDEETKRWVDWVADGSKPLKVEFSKGAEESLKDLFGEDEAKQIIEDVEKRNKDIDDKKE